MKKIKAFLSAIMLAVSFASCNNSSEPEVTPQGSEQTNDKVVQNADVPVSTQTYMRQKYYTAPDNVWIRDIMSISEENIVFSGNIQSGFENFAVLQYGENKLVLPEMFVNNELIDVIDAGDNYLIVWENAGTKEMSFVNDKGDIISSTEISRSYKHAEILSNGKIAVADIDAVQIYNENLELEKDIKREDFTESEKFYIYDMSADSKGNIYCFLWNKFDMISSVYSINQSGEINIIENSLADLGDNIEKIFINAEDNLIVCALDNGRCLFDVVDVSTGKVLTLDEIEDVSAVYGATSKYDIVYSNEKGLYGYNIKTGVSENLISSDKYPDKKIFKVFIFDDDICLIVGSYTESEDCIIISDYDGNITQKYPSDERLVYTNRDNEIYYIEEKYDNKSLESAYINKVGASGNERLFEMTGIDENAYISGVAVDNNNNIIVLLSNESDYLYVYNMQGELISNSEIRTDDYIKRLIYDKEKNVIAVSNKGVYMINSDFTLSDTGFSGDSYYYASACDIYDFLYWTDNSLYGHSFDTQKSEGIWLWNDVIVDDMSVVQNLYTDESGAYYNSSEAVYKVGKTETYTNEKQIRFSISTYSDDIKEKLKRAVKSFNNENSDYHIQIVDFSFEKPDTDNMISSVVQGDIPDIMMIDTYDNIMPYLCKDAFADINKLIESDNELTHDMFYKNILDAFTFNDKLYCMPVIYSFDTMVTNNAGIIEEPSQFYDAVKESGEMILVNTNGSGGMAEYLLYSYIIENVDFEKNKCNFNTPEFTELLKFIKEYVPYEFCEEDLPEELYDENVLFADTFSVRIDRAFLHNYVSGTDICGYPSFDGYIDTDVTFAISEKSEYKEIAWEFIKYFMDYYAEETQGDMVYDSHILRSHNEKLMEILEQYRISEEDYMPTDKERERYNKLFEGTWKSRCAYIGIYNILADECMYYFESDEGDISAEDVANSVQSKISLYMSEIS